MQHLIPAGSAGGEGSVVGASQADSRSDMAQYRSHLDREFSRDRNAATQRVT